MSLDTLTDEVDWEERPPARPRWPLVVAGALLAFVAVYVAAAAWFGDRVPRGTTVSGVAVGGQSGDDATATLTTALGSVAAKPIVLTSTAGKVQHHPQGPRPAGRRPRDRRRPGRLLAVAGHDVGARRGRLGRSRRS